MGPLWWSAHHRNHHKYSEEEKDIHSPIVYGFLWSHMGWIMSKDSYSDNYYEEVPDIAKYPEIRFVDKYYYLFALIYLFGIIALGYYFETYRPELNTSIFQMIVWGFLISTVVLYHCTFSINSFTHLFGKKRFDTGDESRNSFLLALITHGEGWHNNHHHYMNAERQSLFWWEIDMTHYVLTILSWFRIVWDIQKAPAWVYEKAKESISK